MTSTPPKKKINAVSQASLELLNPIWSMGIEGNGSWGDSGSPSSSQSKSSEQAAGPSSTGAQSSHRSHKRTESQMSRTTHLQLDEPTPELEAFAMQDMQSVMDSNNRSYDDSYERAPPVAQSMLGSFFEDDADQPEASAYSPASGRRVAFRVRGGSQDSGSPDKTASSKSSAQNSASSIARFFGWKKGAKKSQSSQSNRGDVFDEKQPSSAPPSILHFNQAAPQPSDYAHSSSPIRNTPAISAQQQSVNGSPLASPALMPHRKGGPPPRGILRKQSAPSLHSDSERQQQMSPPQQMSAARRYAAENSESVAPASVSQTVQASTPTRRPTLRQGQTSPSSGSSLQGSNSLRSSSSQSSLDRRYQTTSVGRGVARSRLPSDASVNSAYVNASNNLSASSSSGSSKASSVRRRPALNKRFEGMPDSPPVMPRRIQGASNAPGQDERGHLFSLPEQSMASKVASGMLNHSRGFEEPLPRSASKVSSGSDQSSSRSSRRRSRSVGALDAPQSGFFPRPPLRDASPSGGGQLQPVAAEQPLVITNVTPTQRSVEAFSEIQPHSLSPRRHKSGNSVDSVSSDSSMSEEAAVVETVQARRVQLGARAKATALSSPSLNRGSRFSKASPVPVVNVLPPSSPSVQGSSPNKPQQKVQTVARKRVPKALLGGGLDEETLRKRWSRRDSCILALSLAQMELPDSDDELESLTESLSYDEDPSPTMELPASESTAPLNIKRRSPEQRDEGGLDVLSDSASGTLSEAEMESEAESMSTSASASNSVVSSSLSSSDSIGSDGLPMSESRKLEALIAASPQILNFAPTCDNLAANTSESESMPSLGDSTSASSVASSDNGDDRGATPTPADSVQDRKSSQSLMPHSNSASSLVSVGTSIFDLGMRYDEAQQYVDRGRFSRSTQGARTPTMHDDESFGPPGPAINVTHHHHGDSLDKNDGDDSELGYLRSNENRLSAERRRTKSRSPSPVSTRSLTPTQERPVQRRNSRGSPQSARAASLGLGLDLGQVRVLEPDVKYAMGHGQYPASAAEVGTGQWEDELASFQRQQNQQHQLFNQHQYHDALAQHHHRFQQQYQQRGYRGDDDADDDNQDAEEWEMGVAM